MNELFADILDICVIVYLDDILIYSEEMGEHRRQVKVVLKRLKANGLYMLSNKCVFY